MRITLLGTGTPAPSLTRQSSGYLFHVGDDLIVVDRGPGAHHRLLESGHRATDVTHAFFSHLHYDHCLNYARLVLQRWDMGADRIDDLQVYGPTPIAQMSARLFGSDGAFAPDIRARMEHQSSLDVFQGRGGALPRRPPSPQVRVGHAAHVQPQLECLAFRLDTDDGSICYSGDSGACDEIVALARGCDILIHMNHHFPGTEPSAAYRAACGSHRDNAAIAGRAGVKTLVLTHVLEEIDRPAVREQVLSEIQQAFAGRVIWGEDLMVLTLPEPGT